MTQGIFGQSAVRLYEALIEYKQLTDKIQRLNTFFYNLTGRGKFPRQTLLSSVLQHINHHRRRLSVEQPVRYTGYTERHMERIFAEQIGMSQKKLSILSSFIPF